MDSGAYQDAIYHPYADMKKSSDALFVVLIGPWKNQPMCSIFSGSACGFFELDDLFMTNNNLLLLRLKFFLYRKHLQRAVLASYPFTQIRGCSTVGNVLLPS